MITINSRYLTVINLPIKIILYKMIIKSEVEFKLNQIAKLFKISIKIPNNSKNMNLTLVSKESVPIHLVINTKIILEITNKL